MKSIAEMVFGSRIERRHKERKRGSDNVIKFQETIETTAHDLNQLLESLRAKEIKKPSGKE